MATEIDSRARAKAALQEIRGMDIPFHPEDSFDDYKNWTTHQLLGVLFNCRNFNVDQRTHVITALANKYQQEPIDDFGKSSLVFLSLSRFPKQKRLGMSIIDHVVPNQIEQGFVGIDEANRLISLIFYTTSDEATQKVMAKLAANLSLEKGTDYNDQLKLTVGKYIIQDTYHHHQEEIDANSRYLRKLVALAQPPEDY